jgi:hypothetical protein
MYTAIDPLTELKVGLKTTVPVMSKGADMIPEGPVTLTEGVLSRVNA